MFIAFLLCILLVSWNYRGKYSINQSILGIEKRFFKSHTEDERLGDRFKKHLNCVPPDKMWAAQKGKDSKVIYFVCQEVGLGLIGKMQRCRYSR